MTPDRLSELRAYQRGWIKGRDECWKAQDLGTCVRDAYAIRILELRRGYADARTRDAEGVSAGPRVLECPDLPVGIAAVFIRTEPAIAVLAWQDRAVALSQIPAASGARYEGRSFDGDHRLWTQGGSARFERPGEAPLECRLVDGG